MYVPSSHAQDHSVLSRVESIVVGAPVAADCHLARDPDHPTLRTRRRTKETYQSKIISFQTLPLHSQRYRVQHNQRFMLCRYRTVFGSFGGLLLLPH